MNDTVDTTCKPCRCCGGFPKRVDCLFNVSDMIVHRGKRVKVEQRTYYHCPCGECTTDWNRPERDCAGNVVREAWQSARDAYVRRKWAKPYGKRGKAR